MVVVVVVPGAGGSRGGGGARRPRRWPHVEEAPTPGMEGRRREIDRLKERGRGDKLSWFFLS